MVLEEGQVRGTRRGAAQALPDGDRGSAVPLEADLQNPVRRSMAVMFTDISGFSTRMERDEAGALASLDRQRKALAAQLEICGGTLVKEMIATVGENISVRRFVRFEMGEGLQKKEENFADEVMKQIR